MVAGIDLNLDFLKSFISGGNFFNSFNFSACDVKIKKNTHTHKQLQNG